MSFIYRNRKDEDYAIGWKPPKEKKVCPIGEIAINSVVERNRVLFKVVGKVDNRVILKPLDPSFVMSVDSSIEFTIIAGF